MNDSSYPPQKKKHNVKTHLIWVAVLAAAHLAFSLIFAVALNTQVNQLWLYGEEAKAKTVVFVYGLIAQIVFCVIYTVSLMRDAELNRLIKDSVKEKQSVLSFFREKHIKDLMIGLVIYAAFNIPYMIFFAVTKIDLANTFAFEKFYIAEMGFYLMTNSAVIGYLLNVLYFSVIFTAIRMTALAITRKNLVANSVTLGE